MNRVGNPVGLFTAKYKGESLFSFGFAGFPAGTGAKPNGNRLSPAGKRQNQMKTASPRRGKGKTK